MAPRRHRSEQKRGLGYMGTIVCNKVDASVGFVLCGVAMAHLYMWPPIYLESQLSGKSVCYESGEVL